MQRRTTLRNKGWVIANSARAHIYIRKHVATIPPDCETCVSLPFCLIILVYGLYFFVRCRGGVVNGRMVASSSDNLREISFVSVPISRPNPIYGTNLYHNYIGRGSVLHWTVADDEMCLCDAMLC